MKKILVLIIGMTLVSSCNDALEEDLYTSPSFSGLETKEDVEGALTGVYAALLGDSNPGYYGRNYLYIREVPTDNLVGGKNDLDRFTFDDNQVELRRTYSDCYSLVLRANLLIENVDAANIDAGLKAKYKAEAKYLLALAYYDLSSMFGGVVLITSSVNDISAKPERTPLEDVEQFIFDKLDEAIPSLSPSKDLDRSGAVTVGAAYTLKLKLHLRRKEWSKVDEMADLIIGLGQYSLLPNVEDLYTIGNSDNSEIIFSVKTTGDPLGKGLGALAAGSTDIAQHNYDFGRDYWGFGTYRIELPVYYSFDPSDERFIKLFRHTYPDRGGAITGPKTLDKKHPPHLDKSQPFVYCEKYQHPLAGTQTDLRSDIYHANTLFVSRYAEVLLGKAEALNELTGPSGEVYGLINQVRNRSNLPNLETTGTFDQTSLRDAIFQERQWEFFMEGYRREDLIRQGTFVSKIMYSHVLSTPLIDVKECDQLFPIPALEIQLNPNITQNICE